MDSRPDATPRPGHPRLYRTVRGLLKSIVPLWFKVRADGTDHVPPDGGLLVISNHQSVLDPVLIGVTLSRACHYMARDSLFKGPFGRLIGALNAFPVRRGTADLTAMREGVRRLAAGHALCVFPEGTRSVTGRVAPLLPGVLALARRGRAPVLPVAIEGVVELWPRGRRWPRRGPVWLRCGAPIGVDRLGGPPDIAAQRLTTWLRALHNGLRHDVGRRPFDYNGAESMTDPS